MCESENKKRVFLFDNAKLLLITAVVVGHFAEAGLSKSNVYGNIFLFIYAFHMPLFIFFSGLFNKNKNVAEKVISFVFLGFAVKIIFALARIITDGKASFSLLSDGGIPWYMFVLAGYYLISYILRNVDKRIVLIMFVLLACFVGYDESIRDYLYLSRFIVFYPFFVLGEMLSTEAVVKINSNKAFKVLSFCIVVLWIILCFTQYDTVSILRPLFTGRNPFSINSIFEKWGFFYRLISYAASLLISFSVLCLVPKGKIPFITAFGARTLQVYIWHWPVVLVLKKIGVLEFLLESPTGKLVWLLIGVVVTLLLCLKLFSFPAKQILNCCKKETTRSKLCKE